VATTPVTNGPAPDVLDEHYYDNDPSYFASNAHLFDDMSRTGQPKIIVGEYATTQGTPTGTLADALGESAFLTGLERNADLVIGASYAPLLVNVNAPSWSTNLIGYDALHSYGSPSYWVAADARRRTRRLRDRITGDRRHRHPVPGRDPEPRPHLRGGRQRRQPACCHRRLAGRPVRRRRRWHGDGADRRSHRAELAGASASGQSDDPRPL
jgi:hypothetical protein